MKWRNIIVLGCLLIFPWVGLRAECTGWSVAIEETPATLCAAKSVDLSMSVLHESEELLTADYRWMIKKPSSSDYEQVATNVSTSYPFNEVGIYSIYAEAKPNKCTDYQSSPVVTIELYPATVAGIINGNQTICYNTIPTIALTETSTPSGGDNSFSHQWQKSTDGLTWNDISGETNTSYQPDALTETTQFRLQYTNSCVIITSNVVTISVRTPATAPVVTPSVSTLCYNENTTLLTCSTEASGAADETFDYRWQESANGSDFSDISGAIGLTYTTPKQTSARWYRVVATSSQGCGSVASSPVKVDVYPDWSISNTTTEPLCYMAGGSISVSVTGSASDYLYQWQEQDGSSWNNISSANSAAYSIPGKAAGTYKYRALVAPTNGCSSKYSDIFTVTVYDELTANTIIGVDTICYNNTPIALSQSVAPAGGNGSFTYQWQKSNDKITWSDINGATATTYQPSALTTTTYFRLVATTSCGSVTSNTIEVYVRKDLTAPVIPSSAETVCYGFAPALITIPTLATCDIHDSLAYQWQQKTTGDWQNIPGATALTYQPEAITSTHQYRVIATSVKGCSSRESNVRTVNVYDDLQISTSGIAPLCYMTRGTISVTATGEGGSYGYQWQDSTDGVWSDIASAVAKQYLTQPKTQGDYFYRCIVLPIFGCTPDTSAIIKVTVYDSVAPGKIAPVGADTICYGFTHDPISVSEEASGGDGSFTYHWMRRQEGVANFSYIPGATSTTYTPTAALYKTTEYQLEVTSACDVKYTNSVRIYVRDEMQAPVLAAHLDTICYNTIPEPIVASTLAKAGVDDSIMYQWETSSDGISFSDIAGETTTTYQPGTLLKTQFYRLRASSVKQCGNITSNIVKVNVYDTLLITAVSPDTLCNMTSATISVSAISGGEDYSYQWQESISDVWTDIAGANAHSYETDVKPKGTYLYRCIVSSNKCDNYARISPVIKVNVYEALTPGVITGTDSTCYGFAPAGPLFVKTTPTGVDGKYTYQWQVSENGEWKDIKGETKTSYQPDVLIEGTDYRLKVSSKCDTLYTNNIFVRVNPLPAIQIITGPNNVCYNQHEIYTFEKLNPGFTYEWMVERGEGDLTTEAVNTSSIDILWKTPNSSDSVILHVTNNITGCEREMKFGVSICNEQAPERTVIVRKPNSNILICEEDGQLIYQWGYTEKSSLQEFPIEDSNRRYVLLPHSFDDVTYDYWLTLKHSESSPCYSRSYYSPANDALINPTEAGVSVPSFVKGRIPIEVQNPSEAPITCAIFTLSGEPLARYELGKESYLSTTLPITLHAGMYVMHVTMGGYVKSIKLIAE